MSCGKCSKWQSMPPPPPSFCACARSPSNPHATHLKLACEQQTHFRSSLLRERNDDRKCVCGSQATLKQVVSSFPSFRPPGKQPYFFLYFKNDLLWVCQWKVLPPAKEKELKTRNKKYKLLTFGLRALFYAFNVCIRLWRSSWEYIWRQIR